jgi:hypothetical protein
MPLPRKCAEYNWNEKTKIYIFRKRPSAHGSGIDRNKKICYYDVRDSTLNNMFDLFNVSTLNKSDMIIDEESNFTEMLIDNENDIKSDYENNDDRTFEEQMEDYKEYWTSVYHC